MYKPRLQIWVVSSLVLAGCTATATPGVSNTSPPTTSSPAVVEGPETSTTQSPSLAAPAQMPDFIGQKYEDAYSSLTRYNVQIKKVLKIAPAQEGVIIEQDPIGGADFSQQITLTVSVAPPKVPDVAGQTFDTAEQSLSALGFSVKEEPVFDDPRADGYVVGQSPPKGTANASEVTLSVVRKPIQTYLSDKDTVGQEGAATFENGAQKANGANYAHSVTFSSSRSSSATVEYDLSREYRRLVSAVALANDASSDAQYDVEILGDGRQLFSNTIVFGKTVNVKVDVTKVLRLKIVITDTSGITTNSYPKVVFGDIRIQGLPAEVTTVPTESPTTP